MGVEVVYKRKLSVRPATEEPLRAVDVMRSFLALDSIGRSCELNKNLCSVVKMREDEFGAYFQFTPGWGKLAGIARRK